MPPIDYLQPRGSSRKPAFFLGWQQGAWHRFVYPTGQGSSKQALFREQMSHSNFPPGTNKTHSYPELQAFGSPCQEQWAAVIWAPAKDTEQKAEAAETQGLASEKKRYSEAVI